jgi:hypothetical protein
MERGRGGKEAFVVADEQVLGVIETAERCGGGSRVLGMAVGRVAAAGRERGIDDRAVAGTAAQVSGEPVGHRLAVGDLARLIEREQAHDEARRAEAALRAVIVDHRLLHGVEGAALGRQVVDRHHVGAVGHAGHQDAAVDGLVDHLAVDQPAERHGAGAAVAFGAALLGAAGAFAQPEVVEQHLGGLDVGQFDQLAAAEEADGGAHVSCPDRWNSRRARAAAARDSAARRQRCRSAPG